MKRGSTLLILTLLAGITPAQSQAPTSKLEGMWSDPPATALGTFCFFSCMDAATDRLNKLLDDPANDARPARDLIGEAKVFEGEYLKARLTPEALKHFPWIP